MKTESTQCDSNTVSPDGQVPRPAERLSQPTTECGAYALSGRVQALCMVLIAVILVSNLGLDPLRGSEGRWAVIARSMFRTGDLFNPLLGLKPYWDKPLLSYWQILPGAWLFGGVTEFSLRLPSVLWGIVMLVLTYDLARRLIGKETAVVSVGVLATSYGFVLWARHGQVEMTNAATILLCLWYFVRHKGDNGAGWIYGLGAIAGLCANMKGLTAYAVPGFCIAVWAIVRRDISWLPPLRHLVAASVVSILAYLSIPIMSSLACSSVDPFRLVWRENVVRFFAPFDHKDPVWSYLVAILELTAPYALFLPMVVLHNARDKRYRRPGVADVLIFFGGIYLFFSLSGSRRPYYLLPILPFGAILLGGFLVDFAKGDMRDGLRRWTRGVLLGVGGLLVVASIAGPIAMCRIPVEWRGLLGWRLLPVALACALSGGLMAWRGECLRVERVVMSFLVIGVAYGLFLIPCIAKDRPIREDVAALTALAKPVAFIGKGKADIMFYLDSPHLVLPDLQAAIDWALDADGILILGRRQAPISGFATIVKCRTWSAQHPLADVDAPDRLVQTATVPCE